MHFDNALYALMILLLINSIIPRETIRFAFELTQHGAVSPSHITTSEPPSSSSSLSIIYKDYFNEQWKGSNELTSVGQRQQYILGYHTRLRYIEDNPLLSPSFDPREIYVIATNANCTILSANAQLLGLYPPGTGPKLNERQMKHADPPNDSTYYSKERDELGTNALPNQLTLIPVHNFYLKDHTFELTHSDNCPKISDLNEHKAASQQSLQLLNRFINKFGAQLSMLLGLKDKSGLIDYSYTKGVIETLISEQYDARSMTKIKDSGISIESILEFSHEFMSSDLLYKDDNTIEAALIAMSPTIKELVDWMKQKVFNDLNGLYDSKDYSPPKFVLYVSYAQSLVAFQLFIQHIWTDSIVTYPLFASSAFIELIHTAIDAPTAETDYSVRFKFNNHQYKDVAYKTFIEKASQLIRTDESIKKFCGYMDMKPEFNYYIVIVVALSIASISLIAVMVFVYIRRKKNKDIEEITQGLK